MNNTELEAARRLLFYSTAEAAALIGNVSEQGWRRWEAGSKPVPEDVAETLTALVNWRQKAIAATYDLVAKAEQNSNVVLLWYATEEDWCALKAHPEEFWRPQQSVTAEIAMSFPDRARLVRFDPVAYRRWLGDRPDNSESRNRWAAEQAMEEDDEQN
jgi:hypothetical protein